MKPNIMWGSSFSGDFRALSDSVFGDDFRVNRDCVRWRIHASDLEALSLMVYESAATQLSVMFFESTGTVRADETRFWLGMQSRWWFLSRQWLSFHLRFQSQQGLCALPNPRVSLGSTVVYGFWVGSYTAFSDDFRVNRECVRSWIQASAGDVVSVMLYESTATQFSLAILGSTGTLCANVSTRQPWKHCRLLFLSRQLHSFWWWFLSQQGLCARMNPDFSWGWSLVDAFWVGSNSVFAGDFGVNRGSMRDVESRHRLWS
jgi:hypothetical protein